MCNAHVFRALIYDFYKKNKRIFVWRDTENPYWVFLSEIMLQQTQTFRVEQKFLTFIQQLPTFEALAHAPFAHVLALWKGLGYNRRALYIQQAAQIIVQNFAGQLPRDPATLHQLPGIGPATSCSISTFAFNKPHVFIETNIRAVFIHHFFANQERVHDQDLVSFVTQTLDRENPRQWYYALMDYGVMLKKLYKNPTRKSAHYTQQTKFNGSNRQLRGKILHALLQNSTLSEQEIFDIFAHYEPARLSRVLNLLVQEHLVKYDQEIYFL